MVVRKQDPRERIAMKDKQIFNHRNFKSKKLSESNRENSTPVVGRDGPNGKILMSGDLEMGP